METKHPEGVPPEHLAIREINIGTYAFDAAELWAALDEVAHRARRDLPDRRVARAARARPARWSSHVTGDVRSAMGVNDRAGLMEVEALAQRQILAAHAGPG